VAEYKRIISNIEKGEAKIQRQNDMLKAVQKKIERYKNPWRELKLVYGPNKAGGVLKPSTSTPLTLYSEPTHRVRASVSAIIPEVT